MSKWDRVSPDRKKEIFAYNAARAADSAAAADMRAIVNTIGRLPASQLKKVLTSDVLAILARYGVEVN